MQTVINIILLILSGALTAYFANQRGRDPYIWFFWGMFLGLLGLILLFILPNLQEEEKQERGASLDPLQDVLPSIRFQEWFYLDQKREQIGPLSFDLLLNDWKAGKISMHTYVWSPGMTDWQKVKSLPDLCKALSI